MNSVFGEQILADELSKLNSTQQCIETLSHWCIFHRSKAEQVVATWDKQFRSSDMAQKVPLLYLANDILQNSKRKGNEFVTEFWKVLPSALKDLTNKGDDRGKKVVSRLVGIWEERKVFGSHAQSLKDIMLGEELPPPLEFRKKRSRSVRIVKKDSRSIKTKLSIGGTAEKIVSAFHSVLSEHATEDEQMSKCKSVIHRVKKMEKDIDVALTKAKDPSRKKLSEGLEEEEKKLKQCIDKLKEIETNRVALVSELRDALHEQESELENLRTQMQVAQAHVQEATNTRKQLGEDRTFDPKQLTTVTEDANSKQDQTSKKSAAATAAEVADRLAASSSSQYIMASVLSTFAAEEAKNAGLSTSSTPTTSSFSSNAENQNQNHIPVSDPNVFTPSQQQINPPHNPPYQYHSIGNPPSMQYMQSYDYGNIPPMPAGLPPPAPAPPSYMVSPMVPMMQQQPLQMSHQPQIPQPASFRPLTPIQPPGMVYYTHPVEIGFAAELTNNKQII